MKPNELILKLILLMAFADAKFKEEEQEYIEQLCNELNVSDEEYKNILNQVESESDLFIKSCRQTAKLITKQEDRDLAIQFLSKMMAKDKIVHRTEIFVLQLIAEEWNMFIDSPVKENESA